MFDKAKAIFELKKIQSALAKETVETEAGNGAVKVTITGEMKLQKVQIDPEKVDTDNLEALEKWIETAVNQGIKSAQMMMAEKMKSVSGGLGIPGL